MIDDAGERERTGLDQTANGLEVLRQPLRGHAQAGLAQERRYEGETQGVVVKTGKDQLAARCEMGDPAL